MSGPKLPRVVVLLSTYNGDVHLDEQLSSIAAQSTPCAVVVRDDGSSDSTVEIVERWRGHLVVSVVRGPNVGPASSYLQLLMAAPEADYYAFADQDDFWDVDKTSLALRRLDGLVGGKPALYFSATRIVDESLRLLSISRLDSAPTLATALVRNVASGCTMVFNRQLLEVLKEFPFSEMAMHDSWALKVCLAVGGDVVYDPIPHISYRQHAGNVIGSEPTVVPRVVRWVRSPAGTRSNEARELLDRYRKRMPANCVLVTELVARYADNMPAKIRLLAKREYWSGDLASRVALFLSILLGRL